MHEVLVNRLGGLSLPRKSVVRLTDRPDMTLDVYRGRKTTIQYNGTFSIKFHMQPSSKKEKKVYLFGPSHMTRMAAMPVYGTFCQKLLGLVALLII